MSIFTILKTSLPDIKASTLKEIEQKINNHLENRKGTIASDEVRVFGVERASHVDRVIKESSLGRFAYMLHIQHSDQFNIFPNLRVEYPNGKEVELEDVINTKG